MLNLVERVHDRVPLRLALVSVSDKRGLDTCIPALARLVPGLRFLSTGGTHAVLTTLLGPAAADRLRPVSDYTGQPETQGGLVKTLDFKIYLGLLCESDNPAHARDLQRTGAEPIDLVVCNLYPFAAAAGAPGATVESARGHIDIGGPCMLRAAAKNFLRVASVCDPDDYPSLLQELAAHGGTLGFETRYRLACKAFRHTADYDEAIATRLPAWGAAGLAAAYRPAPPPDGARP